MFTSVVQNSPFNLVYMKFFLNFQVRMPFLCCFYVGVAVLSGMTIYLFVFRLLEGRGIDSTNCENRSRKSEPRENFVHMRHLFHITAQRPSISSDAI